MYACRSGQRQLVDLPRNDTQPTQSIAQIGRGTERRPGDESTIMYIDIGLPRAVEKHHTGSTGGTQLVYYRNEIGKVAAYFHGYGNMYDSFYFLQNLDMQFPDGAGTILGRGVDFLHVQLYGAGSGFFEIGGETLPAAVVVTVDTGYYRYRYRFPGFAYQREVFFHFVGFDDILQIVVGLGIIAIGTVEQMFALGGELLFKERFQHNGPYTGFFESDDFFDIVGQARTGCDNRIFQF